MFKKHEGGIAQSKKPSAKRCFKNWQEIKFKNIYYTNKPNNIVLRPEKRQKEYCLMTYMLGIEQRKEIYIYIYIAKAKKEKIEI